MTDITWTDPKSIIYPGWYWVKDNSGDRWIAFADPEALDYDPNFGWSEDDKIQVAGPIELPKEGT
jgi:hypothetical protein